MFQKANLFSKENLKMKTWKDWLYEGATYTERGQFKLALDCYKEALKLHDKDYSIFLSLGFSYYHFGETKKALVHFKKAIKLNKYDYMSWIQIGQIYMEMLEYDKAIKNCQKILKISPDCGQAKKLIGLCSRHKSLFDSLKSKTTQLSKESQAKFFNGVKILNNKKYYESSIEFKEVLKNYPDFPPAMTWLATSLIEMGKLKEGIDYFNKVIAQSPNDFMAWCNKGLALNRLQKFEEAIKCFDKAIEINPRYSASWNNEGLAFKKLQNYHRSIECFNKSISVNPNLEFGWVNKAEVLFKLSRYEEALECYIEALKLNPFLNIIKDRVDDLKIKIAMKDTKHTGRISITIGDNYCPNCSQKDYTNSSRCQICGFKIK